MAETPASRLLKARRVSRYRSGLDLEVDSNGWPPIDNRKCALVREPGLKGPVNRDPVSAQQFPRTKATFLTPAAGPLVKVIPSLGGSGSL